MEDYKKKYEDALDNFKKIKAANKDNKELVDFIEYKYPELKESEDERIRKAIFKALSKKDARDVLLANGIQVSDALAWLEKPKYAEEDLNKAYKCADEVQYRRGYEDAKKEIEKQGELEPAWSEEDEKYYDSALWHIKNSCGIEGNIYNWLKSLRERMKGE